jgi:hypothetical protein
MFDVGCTGIRVCQLGGRANRIAIRDHLQLTLPPGARGDARTGAGIDCSRLSRARDQGKFSGREIGLVLSPPAVQFHTLGVPNHLLDQPREAVCSALAWEIARETRTEPDNWEIRYWPFPPGHRPGRNIMTAAISAPLIRGWVSEFSRFGLHLRNVTASPCALARVAAREWAPGESDIWGVIDIGHRRSIITLLVSTSPVYVRELPYGSGDWTQRLASVFDVAESDAEEIKRRHGLRPAGADSVTDGVSGDKDLHGVLIKTLQPAIHDLAREINRCFMYLLESYPRLNVARLFVAGGGAALEGLTEHLNELLDLPTTRLTCGSAGLVALDKWAVEAPLVGAAAFGGSLLDVEARRCKH